jgi:DNA-binding HxlR family transcriptional regulator
MRSKSFAGMACSIAGALEAVGDRWGFLIVRDLSLGMTRHDQIQKSLGIPPTTLSHRLDHLESVGLVERRRYSERPPRDEYLLTQKGRDLWLVTLALAQWGDRWDASGRGAPPVDFIDVASGRPVKLALVDAQTGEPVPPGRMRPRPGRGADERVRLRFSQREAAQ